MSQECTHNWQFQHTVWWDAKNEHLPGTSAVPRYLADRYYCTKCLCKQDANKRVHGNSYNTKPAGVVPA